MRKEISTRTTIPFPKVIYVTRETDDDGEPCHILWYNFEDTGERELVAIYELKEARVQRRVVFPPHHRVHIMGRNKGQMLPPKE